MASTLADLTGFQRDLLVAIRDLAGANGQAVKDVLDEQYGEEINHGRLYPNLDELADKGLIKKGRINDRSNSYILTRRGGRELAEYRDWVIGAEDT